MKLYEVAGLNVPTFAPSHLAKKHGVAVDVIQQQLIKGIQVELEHTTDKKIAREIALDHIGEDPKYYDKLNRYVEKNKMTESKSGNVVIRGKEVNHASIRVGGVHKWDAPDYSDAYIEFAKFVDGTPLSDDDLDQLSGDRSLVNTLAHRSSR